jgi:hypothetical protein
MRDHAGPFAGHVGHDWPIAHDRPLHDSKKKAPFWKLGGNAHHYRFFQSTEHSHRSHDVEMNIKPRVLPEHYLIDLFFIALFCVSRRISIYKVKHIVCSMVCLVAMISQFKIKLLIDSVSSEMNVNTQLKYAPCHQTKILVIGWIFFVLDLVNTSTDNIENEG